MRTLKNATINGLELAYLDAGNGPLVVCLHGYPDTADTWAETVDSLVKRGYRVVTPYLRGYYPSAIPDDGDYSTLSLAQDLIGLLDHLQAQTAIVLGHDWGALTAYSAAGLAPERIEKLVTVDMLHPRAFQLSLTSTWKGRHIIAYQFKNAAMRRLQANNFAHIDEIYRRWSPNWSFGPEETALVKEYLAKPGHAEAALGYYWCFAQDFRNAGPHGEEPARVARRKIEVPTLCIVGDWGAISAKQMAATPAAFTGRYEYEIFDDVGHFVHREAPERFQKRLFQFLES